MEVTENTMKMETGFTLIELLITLAVAALLLAGAVPAMRAITQNNLLAAVTNRMVATFQFSRSEAVERRTQVTVCAANADQTACSGDATTWDSQGWLSFIDPDGDGVVDANETVLKVWAPLHNSTAITVQDDNSNALSFMGWLQNGIQADGETVGIQIAANGSSANDRCIQIGAPGWVKSNEIASGVPCP